MTKTRSYKVQAREGVPCLTIRGKFLNDTFGIDVGTQLQLIEGKNMMILVKVPTTEIERKQNLERLEVCEKEAQYLRSVLKKGELIHD